MHLTLASTDQTFVNGTGADMALVTTTEASGYLLIQNRTGADLKLKWGSATGTSADIILVDKEKLEYFSRRFMPVGALRANGANGQPILVLHK